MLQYVRVLPDDMLRRPIFLRLSQRVVVPDDLRQLVREVILTPSAQPDTPNQPGVPHLIFNLLH